MAANPNVLFKLISRANFDLISTKDSGTFYRVTESDGSESLYQGANKLDRNDLDVTEFALGAKDGTTNVITLKGLKEVDGAISAGTATANDIVFAAVAATGAAEDVSIADAGGLITADNVEGALQELASASAGGVASKTVYITETSGGSGDLYSKRYGVYQGATGSAASPVVGEKLVDIDIPKDMVCSDGEVVDVVFKSSDNTLHEGSESGTDVTTEIMGSTTPTAANAGKYIKLTIANATSTHLWIPAKDLVDIYTAQQNATQIQLAIDSNNVISATVVAGSIGTTELGSKAVTTAKIDDGAVGTTQLSSGVNTSLGLADSAVQSVAEGTANGTIAVDGADVSVHGLGTAAFQNVDYFDVSGAAATAESNAESYADTAIENALTWEVVSGS